VDAEDVAVVVEVVAVVVVVEVVVEVEMVVEVRRDAEEVVVVVIEVKEEVDVVVVLEKGTRRRVSDTTGTKKNQTEGNYGRKEVRDQEKHRTIAVRGLEVPGARGGRSRVPKFAKG